MNPSSKYGGDFDYQVIDMDAAQENRFVWLNMESDTKGWIAWAVENGIEDEVIEFISTFPEHLHSISEDDIRATPRSFERVSKVYKLYKENKESIPKSVFLNVLRGNLGRVIAEEFMGFVESESTSLISYEEVFEGAVLSLDVIEKLKKDSHTRLYLTANNILRTLDKELMLRSDKDSKDKYINRFIEFIKVYPVDLMIGIMKDMRENYKLIYSLSLENEDFVETYFNAYNEIKG